MLRDCVFAILENNASVFCHLILIRLCTKKRPTSGFSGAAGESMTVQLKYTPQRKKPPNFSRRQPRPLQAVVGRSSTRRARPLRKSRQELHTGCRLKQYRLSATSRARRTQCSPPRPVPTGLGTGLCKNSSRSRAQVGEHAAHRLGGGRPPVRLDQRLHGCAPYHPDAEVPGSGPSDQKRGVISDMSTI